MRHLVQFMHDMITLSRGLWLVNWTSLIEMFCFPPRWPENCRLNMKHPVFFPYFFTLKTCAAFLDAAFLDAAFYNNSFLLPTSNDSTSLYYLIPTAQADPAGGGVRVTIFRCLLEMGPRVRGWEGVLPGWGNWRPLPPAYFRIFSSLWHPSSDLVQTPAEAIAPQAVET